MEEYNESYLLLKRVFDMMEYAYPALNQYPKSEKFALAVDIKRCMDTVLELVVEAGKKYTKKTTLRDLDIALAKLKVYIRLSHTLKFLPDKKYDLWSEQVSELGKMVGGWIKTESAR